MDDKSPKDRLVAASSKDRIDLITKAIDEWCAITRKSPYVAHGVHRAFGLLVESLERDLPKLKDDKP